MTRTLGAGYLEVVPPASEARWPRVIPRDYGWDGQVTKTAAGAALMAGISGTGSAAPDAAAPPITVVIADDQRMVRRGFRVILESEPGIEVVAEAGDGAQAVELVRRHAPTVALLDIRMPAMDGMEAARRVLALGLQTRVLILTTFDADEYVYEALRAGASGFLLKDAPADQLVTAVRSLAAGDALIDPVITRRLISRFTLAARGTGGIPAVLRELTPRELDVLRLIARGLSNGEIAQELFVEENTVKTHVSRILAKLNLRDRVQAVVLAYESAFVTPEDHGDGGRA